MITGDSDKGDGTCSGCKSSLVTLCSHAAIEQTTEVWSEMKSSWQRLVSGSSLTRRKMSGRDAGGDIQHVHVPTVYIIHSGLY